MPKRQMQWNNFAEFMGKTQAAWGDRNPKK
jgi:hypothetical protein